MSESGIASDLYHMLHVWTGPLRGGLAVGTIVLMVAISAMNGLSVAGMAIGSSIALPEMLKRNYDKRMVTGVIQAGSSLVIVPPLYIPLIMALGFNPIWYGVLYTITCQIAYMTPPFGYNLFLMKAMAPKEISLWDIYHSILPFVLIMIFGLVIVMGFPEIALWLPEHVYPK